MAAIRPVRSSHAAGTERRTTRTVATVLTVCAAILVVALALTACGGKKTTDKQTASTGPAKTSVIAVAGGAQQDALAAVSREGTSLGLVPGNANTIFDLAWSPDGSWIAYIQNVGGEKSYAPALFLYDVAGQKSTQVLTSADTPAQALDFAWISPTQLVLANHIGAFDLRANGDLSICDATKQELTPLNGADGAQLQGVSLSATPDGKTLAVSQYGKPARDMVPESLLLVDMASKGVKTIDDGEVSKMDEGDNYANLAVSPDGTLVFAEATGSDPGFMTSVYGSDGVKKWVSEPLEFPSLAAWDPKGGDRIVFGGETATAGGSMAGSVLVWDAGQGQVTELTQLEQGRIATAFAWSPDGTSLACAAIRSETGTTDLWTMNADGSGAKLLLKDAAAPSWALSPIDLSAGAAPSTAESASP